MVTRNLVAYYLTRITGPRFGLDDVFILLAMVSHFDSKCVQSILTRIQVSTVALNCLVILATNRFGWNRHVWDIPLNLIQSMRKKTTQNNKQLTDSSRSIQPCRLCF